MTAPITLVQSQPRTARSVLLLLPVYQGRNAARTRSSSAHRRSMPARGTPEQTRSAGSTRLCVIDEVLKDFDFQDGAVRDDAWPTRRPAASPIASSSRRSSRPRAGALRSVAAARALRTDLEGGGRGQPPFLKQLNLRSPWPVFLIGATLALLAGAAVLHRAVDARRKRRRRAALAAGGHRDQFQRRHHRLRPRRTDHRLERRRGQDLRLHRRRGARADDAGPADAGRPPARRRDAAAPHRARAVRWPRSRPSGGTATACRWRSPWRQRRSARRTAA